MLLDNTRSGLYQPVKNLSRKLMELIFQVWHVFNRLLKKEPNQVRRVSTRECYFKMVFPKKVYSTLLQINHPDFCCYTAKALAHSAINAPGKSPRARMAKLFALNITRTSISLSIGELSSGLSKYIILMTRK